MTLKAVFDTRDNIVTFTVTDPTPTAADLMIGYARVLDDPALVADMHSIWNLSTVRLSAVPASEVRKLPGAINKLIARRGIGFKVALVTRNPTDFTLLRMYLSLLKLVRGVHMRIFRTEDEARAWILNKVEAA